MQTVSNHFTEIHTKAVEQENFSNNKVHWAMENLPKKITGRPTAQHLGKGQGTEDNRHNKNQTTNEQGTNLSYRESITDL